jgi:hypothetical protein
MRAATIPDEEKRRNTDQIQRDPRTFTHSPATLDAPVGPVLDGEDFILTSICPHHHAFKRSPPADKGKDPPCSMALRPQEARQIGVTTNGRKEALVA